MSLSFASDDHFFIELVSNVRDITITNRIGNFSTKIAYQINLGKEKLEVGLSEIIYTKSWFNVNCDQKISVIFSDGECANISLCLTSGLYDTVEALITEVGEIIFGVLLKYFNGKLGFSAPNLKYDTKLRKIQIEPGSAVDAVARKRECFTILD